VSLSAVPQNVNSGKSPRDLRRIASKMQALSQDPTSPGSIKLEGEKRYRLRQGDWPYRL
jgi:hypothetical protein